MVGRSFAGTLLVVIGVALLLINLTGVGGVAVVLLGGLAFLATYLATRSYGFLVPGGHPHRFRCGTRRCRTSGSSPTSACSGSAAASS
jgi:hypothetical protein